MTLPQGNLKKLSPVSPPGFFHYRGPGGVELLMFHWVHFSVRSIQSDWFKGDKQTVARNCYRNIVEFV